MYSIKIKLDVVLGYKGMTLKELSYIFRSIPVHFPAAY
jgi:hypothetical protein